MLLTMRQSWDFPCFLAIKQGLVFLPKERDLFLSRFLDSFLT